jgi:hypothetical protein
VYSVGPPSTFVGVTSTSGGREDTSQVDADHYQSNEFLNNTESYRQLGKL